MNRQAGRVRRLLDSLGLKNNFTMVSDPSCDGPTCVIHHWEPSTKAEQVVEGLANIGMTARFDLDQMIKF